MHPKFKTQKPLQIYASPTTTTPNYDITCKYTPDRKSRSFILRKSDDESNLFTNSIKSDVLMGSKDVSRCFAGKVHRFKFQFSSFVAIQSLLDLPAAESYRTVRSTCRNIRYKRANSMESCCNTVTANILKVAVQGFTRSVYRSFET